MAHTPTLVVETGAGLANANSYVDLAYATAYLEDRDLLTSWGTGDDGSRLSALIKATAYVDMRFGVAFTGYKASKAQALAWPRKSAADEHGYSIDSDEIPTALKQAVTEYALRDHASTSPLAPDPEVSTTGRGLKRQRVVVGPIENEEEFTDGGASVIKAYPTADLLIDGLLRPVHGRVIR